MTIKYELDIHVNNKEYLIRCEPDSEGFKRLRERADATGLKLDEAVVSLAIMDGVVAPGSYPIGVIDWEGCYIINTAETGFSMSGFANIMNTHKARVELVSSWNAFTIKAHDHTPPQGPDDPDFDPEDTILGLMLKATSPVVTPLT